MAFNEFMLNLARTNIAATDRWKFFQVAARNNNIFDMDRRTSVKQLSRFLGLAVSFPYLSGILEGCNEKKPPAWAPLELTGRQQKVLQALSDRIIPPTDTPGAVEAGVPGFIEIVLKDVFPAPDARALLNELENFDKDCRAETGDVFSACTPDLQEDWLRQVSEPGHRYYDLFNKMRELVVGTYFTSEKGMKQALDYVPIPEKFEGCLPVKGNAKLMVGNRL